MQQFIEKEIYSSFRTLRHHLDTTAIVEDIPSDAFFDLEDDILYLANFFSSLDNDYETPLLKKLLIDVVSLRNFINILGSQKQLTIYYKEFKETNPNSDDNFEVFQKLMLQSMEEGKIQTLSILNTKLYYLDMLLWKEALKSHNIVKYLSILKVRAIKTTEQFLTTCKENNISFKSTLLNLKFTVDTNDLYVNYSQEELGYLKKLPYQEEDIVDENIQKLIKFKHKIKFFKNMDDDDIKFIVKNVQFAHYNPHEIVIQQNNVDQVIYFIMEGECRVSVDKKSVGMIKEHQIFGEFSSITRELRSATIRTNKPTTLLCFELAFEKFEQDPYSFSFLYRNIVQELITKISIVNAKAF